MGLGRTLTLVFDKRPSFEEIVSKFKQSLDFEIEIKPIEFGITVIDTRNNKSVSIYYTDAKSIKESIVKFKEYDYEHLYVFTIDTSATPIAETAMSILHSLGGKDFDE